MEIEQTFVRQRGRHMLLGPLDWALIEGWNTRGVPLHVVLRSMEVVFERHCRTRRRSINSLSYYADEVDVQFEEWLTSQTGRGIVLTDQAIEHEPSEKHLPFPRAVILEHVANCRAAIRNALDTASDDSFSETLRSVTAELEKLELNFAQAVAPDCGDLESALIKLEGRLYEDILARIPPKQLSTWRDEAELQLTSYRGRMKPDDYERAVASLLHKYLRERMDIPRLSLFSL